MAPIDSALSPWSPKLAHSGLLFLQTHNYKLNTAAWVRRSLKPKRQKVIAQTTNLELRFPLSFPAGKRL